jgi:acyl-CoA reductase-like NAD-dependent aldehyde dehydrogenase
MVLKEPYGVVVGIAPWNATFILGFRAVTYALAAGNTVVFKASEVSPRSLGVVGTVFREAGLPDGVLNVIQHAPEDAPAVTKALIEHPAIKKINFTGSTAVGRIIAELAGKNLKPVLLELGGKAPAIALDDADLPMAARACAMGAFLHSGQICMSTERIVVEKGISAKFADEVSLRNSNFLGDLSSDTVSGAILVSLNWSEQLLTSVIL